MKQKIKTKNYSIYELTTPNQCALIIIFHASLSIYFVSFDFDSIQFDVCLSYTKDTRRLFNFLYI